MMVSQRQEHEAELARRRQQHESMMVRERQEREAELARQQRCHEWKVMLLKYGAITVVSLLAMRQVYKLTRELRVWFAKHLELAFGRLAVQLAEHRDLVAAQLEVSASEQRRWAGAEIESLRRGAKLALEQQGAAQKAYADEAVQSAMKQAVDRAREVALQLHRAAESSQTLPFTRQFWGMVSKYFFESWSPLSPFRLPIAALPTMSLSIWDAGQL